MADYYQVKNQNIFNPPANTSLGNATNKFDDVFIQNDLVLGNTTVTGATIVTPKVSTITYPGDDTAADTAGGQTITLTGSGFLTGASVLINGSAVGVVSVVSTTTITFTSPANATGSYVLYVINTDGGTAIAIPGIQYSGTPNWTTAAGSLGSVYETASFNQSVTATGDAPITYSVASGSIPPGATFNSNGTITGTSQLLSSSTTYTFTVKATDAELQDTNRTFSLTINPDVVTWSNPANGTTYTSNVDSAISNITLSATSAVGSGITYTANALPTGLSLTGANISGTPTVIANSSSLLTATANTTSESSNVTINWVINVANDPYFEYNTLLIPGASTTFVDDASTNNFAVTINGDTKPNNNNPYTPGYYSNYFDGSGDYLSTSAGASAFDFSSTKTLTFECWFSASAFSGNHTLLSINECQPFRFIVTSSTLLWQATGSGTTILTTSQTWAVGAWYHIACVRDNDTLYMFVNGAQVATASYSTSWGATSTSYPVSVGANRTDTFYFNGNISNLRLVKGTALYTSSFTPSTTPLTAVSGTSLLTCQSNRFIDNSTNNFTLTVAGNTTVNSFDPFTPNSSYSTYGSGYFDGTGDYIRIAGSVLNNSAFTISFYFYPTTSSVVGLFDSAPNQTSCFRNYPANSIQDQNGGTVAFTPLVNQWNWMSIVGDGTNFTVYLNGSSVGSAAYAGLVDSNFTIGAINNGGDGAYTGYISNFRVKNIASVDSVPTSPLTAVANTSLLTLQNNQSVNNNVFLDNSTNNFFVTRNGNATQGTFSPYGGNWSNYFDGTGDYLSIPSTTALQFGTGDFTVESWVYLTATPSAQFAQIIGRTEYGTNADWMLQITNANKLTFYMRASFVATSTAAIALNTWTHVAVSRSGSSIKLFINGVVDGTATNSGSTEDTGSGVYTIGADQAGDEALLTGYLSNLRVVKGTAVYTANFTPSTTPLTPITNTSLLTCADNRIVDDSINNLTITKNGDTSVQRFSPFNPSSLTPTSYSGYYGSANGASIYLSGADPGGVTLSGNYTIEMWLYPTGASSSGYSILACPNSFGGTFQYYYNSAGKIGYYTVAAGAVLTSAAVLTFNAWQHVALVRSSNVVKVYVNGVEQSFASAITDSTSVGVNFIGGVAAIYSTYGYISNFRVNNTAVYTTNFTAPTSPLTAISGTQLLILQSPTLVDNSTNNYTLYFYGSPQPTQQNPFGYTSATTEGYTVSTIGGSGYFDGTGDYLTVPSSPLFQITGNVTIEAYVYATSINTFQNILSQYLNSTNAFACGYNSTSGWYFNYRNNAAEVTNYRAGASPLNTWTHVAFVKSSTTMTVYINGTALASTITVPDLPQFAALLYVSLWAGASDSPWVGYISDLRMINGAVYTSNFVPPSAPLTAVQNTVLLNNMTSAGIYDAAMTNDIESIGTAVLSTSTQKFNGSNSMYFPSASANASYMKFKTPQSFLFGTGNFTVEMWVNESVVNNSAFYIGDWSTSTGRSSWGFARTNSLFGSSELNFFAGTTYTTMRAAWTPSANTWYHIAVSRSGSSLRLFVDGIQIGTTFTYADSIDNTYGSGSFYINNTNNIGNWCMQGYINNLRVTSGYARYTANFTPPTSAFPIY